MTVPLNVSPKEAFMEARRVDEFQTPTKKVYHLGITRINKRQKQKTNGSYLSVSMTPNQI